MAIAVVQSATQVNVAASSTTAPSITITGATAGNALVAYAAIFDSNTTWTLDSTTDGGNTFTTRIGVATDSAEESRAAVAHAVNITGGDRTVAFNLSGTTGGAGRYYVLGCTEFSGVAKTSAENTWDANDDIDLGTTDVSAGPITTTNASALITGVIADGYNDTTINNASPASWNNTYRQDNGLSFVGMDAGYWLPGSTQTTYTAQWSHDNTAGDFGAGVVVALLPLVATAAITGTATASITEADVVAGGKTVIITLTDDTWVAAQNIQTIQFVNNALGGTTTTTSFSITLPATQADDLIILEYTHRGTTDGTIGGTYTGPAFSEKHDQQYASSAFSGKTLWSRATGNHSGQTVTGSSLTNSCAAIITIYRNCDTGSDPLGDATIVGEQNASGNETQAEITTATDKAWVVLVVVNSPDLAVSTQAATSPSSLTERAEVLSTGGTDTSIAHASAEKATAGGTGSLTWAQTDAASGSWAYAIKPKILTPFADARASIAAGVDSAQAEAGGWDAKVKPNIPVANVVRTSNTVCTITLQAQADYDITAQETITVTVPAAALTGGVAIVGTPTFTVDASAGGGAASAGTLLVPTDMRAKMGYQGFFQ